ncbi:hypothetical protein GCM10011611_35390 [Aliidongia dinghuensis]|uniref:Glycosyltransferase n=1 Tax=Aliidongia dinghuensis TaxID=1867774 RepID=A0A8J3E4Q9_9PROT|nr:glycosyltransferase [Aliidongia dinghuensis]GGF26243.1 hypothetical protein GCM10011611_35390 [Aliidongia dinghuensis]
MSKRLLIVSNFYPPATVGGAEIVAHRQAKALVKRDWDVVALGGRIPSADAPAGSLDVDEFDGIPVYRLSLPSLEVSDNYRWAPAGRALTSLIASHQPQWVHFHNPIGLGADLIPLAKKLGCMVATTLHDNWGFCFKNTRLRRDNAVCSDFDECQLCIPTVRTKAGQQIPMRLRRDYVAHCLDQADLLISPSADLAQAYSAAGFEGRVEVVSNGIDLSSVVASPRSVPSQIRFLCSASLGEHKGILVLLEALKLLGREVTLRDRWVMTIAGHGHLEDRLRSEIKEAGLENNVLLIGRVERGELLDIIKASHAVVLPSIWPENEPVSLLEGLASGAALLATDIGGNPALVEHGKSGLLFKPADPRAIVGAMTSLISEPALIAQYSRCNIARRPEFDEELSVTRIIDLLDRSASRFAQDNPAKEQEVILICGGDHADAVTAIEVGLLAKTVPGLRLRLIWQEHASDEIWERASAFWWWSRTGGLGALDYAVRRGLPVIMRNGREAGILAETLPSIVIYSDGRELIRAIGELRPNKQRDRQYTDVNILRFLNQLRARDQYYLPIEA